MTKAELEEVIKKQKAKIAELERFHHKTRNCNTKLLKQKTMLLIRIAIKTKSLNSACEIISEKVDPTKTPSQVYEMLKMVSKLQVQKEHPEWADIII